MTVLSEGTHSATLTDLVDGLAGRTGAWVVVDRFGIVEAHGPGASECPAPVAATLLRKDASTLRHAVVWSRGTRHASGSLVGNVDGIPVVAADLGEGVTAWFVGASPDDQAVGALTVAVHERDAPVTDAFIEELLHPRGPVRPGHAPRARLLALAHDGPVFALARRASAVASGTPARVHTAGEVVVAALPVDDDATLFTDRVRATCPTVVAGTSVVPEGASDWVATASLARACADAARELAIVLASPSDPLVAAELVVTEAQGAVADLLRELPDAPLRRLEEHDARTSGELVASITAWCRALFDVGAAAAELHVHPNTLRYRLRRATEVCGLDVTRPRQLLALQLLLGV